MNEPLSAETAWWLIGCAGLYVVIVSAISIRALVARTTPPQATSRRRQGVARQPRCSEAAARSLFVQQVLSISAIVLAFEGGDVHLTDLGWSEETSLWIAIPAGALSYGLILMLYRIIMGWIPLGHRFRDEAFHSARLLRPRQPWAKICVIIAVWLLNPWVEEIVYRGILVFLVGRVTGSLEAALLIGGVLTLLSHLYQGLWTIPFHLVFYACVALILCSPLGLAGAIGFHIAGDVVPDAMFRRSMRQWLARRGRSWPPPSFGKRRGATSLFVRTDSES
jgi:membrane protease YdiL (CAAX protease family)